MITTGFDARVKVQQIIENQLPEFVLSESPKAVDFLKQYYISQEYQGGPIDVAENLDQYLSFNNMTQDVVAGITSVTSAVTKSDTTIPVTTTKGFPKEYGLFKIDDEIITYTGITTNSFTGCIRGFSGITSYRDPINSEELVFSTSSAISHTNHKPVENLSALFLKEFYKKLKNLLAPGFEDVDFVNDLDINNFIKQIRNFYQAKGTDESFRILFEVLYGYTPKVINLEDFLIKPSDAEFIRREVLVCERLTGDPNKLVGQMVNNVDDSAAGPVSEVELITRNRKQYYKIQLFSGFDERSLIQGNFTISPKSLATENVAIGASVITVDSTIGFSTSGTVQSGINTSISYTDKSINQFFGCSGVVAGISTADSVISTEYIYGYEDGNTDKMVTLRITGVLADLKDKDTFTLLEKDDLIAVKNVGEKILNRNKNNKEYAFNTWVYNVRTRYEIDSFSGNQIILFEEPDKSSLRKNDVVDILNRNSEGIVNGNATVTGINGKILTLDQSITVASNTELSIRKRYDYASSTNTPLTVPSILANVQNTYNEDDKYMYVASNSLPRYQVTTKKAFADLSITPSTNLDNVFKGYDILTDRYNDIVFASDVPFLSGDVVVYSGTADPIVGLTFGKAYYIEVLKDTPSPGDKKTIRLFDARSFIGDSANCVKIAKYTGTSTHTFTLQRHYGRSLAPKKSLAKFPLETNIRSGTDQSTPVGPIGMMINGVEIINYKSLDRIYYGPLSSVRVLNKGTDYDVINPPKILVSDPVVGVGTTALVTAVVKGSVKEIQVDPQDFSISRVLSATIEGGNGTGAKLEPVLSKVNREVEFNASLVGVALTGGIDATADTIAFTQNHRFQEGQPIVYNPAGNQPIGIGSFQGSNTDQGDYLVSGSVYYPKIINPKAIYLFKKLSDYNSGINTVGFTTINTGGIHKFREYEARNIISEIKVIKPGEGYENRTLNVKPTGISTTFDTVTFNNHGFKDGDLINYSYETTPIVGLTTESQYYILKNDDNSFQLAETGVTDSHLGSVAFDGTGDLFNFAPAGEFAFGPDDFTIETWIKTSSSSADGSKNRTIFMLDGPTGDGARQFKLNINPATRGINVSIEVGLLSFNGSKKIDDNIWHHIAVTRSGDTLRLFVDGSLDASSNYTDNIGSTLNGGSPRPRIGSWDGTNGDFNGYISNFRIIRGSARYVHNFTVSTKPLEKVEGTILLFAKDYRSETSYDITPSQIQKGVKHPEKSTLSPFNYGDGTSRYNYNRRNFTKLSSIGSGYQTFSYPPITISVLADVIGGIGTVTATPLVRGEIVDAFLYEKGTGYGSDILNFPRTPILNIKNGTGAQLKPILSGGKLIAVEVQNGGKNFDAAPDLEVKGKGSGAKLRAVVDNGKIEKVIILNKGTNYEDKNTSIFIKAVGRNCVLDSAVRHLTVNNYKRFGDEVLEESGDNLGYGVVGYSTAREGIAFDDSTTTAAHSKVIGWAYDGNPIYGPFGYSDPNDINSSIRKLDTGYSVSASNVENRPPTTNFEEGFFIEDHMFNNTGDLDIHNGRFTKTPEYVNGIYAYHVGVNTDLSTGNLVPEFPYFLGDTFRSNQTVNILDQSFDFNNSSLVRNTFPYRVSQTYSGNDFVTESNEGYNQFSVIESASKGSIDSIKVVNPGTKYRIGNSVQFDNSSTGGGGATAEVSEIDGHKINSIETSSQIFNDSVIVWENQNQLRVYTHHTTTHSPKYHSLTNADDISLSGINTTIIPGLIKSHVIGVASETASLIDDIPANVGFYTDMYVSSIPPTVGAGSTIGIGTERFMVLNRFDEEKVLRVEREVPGIAHTGGDTIDFFADSFTIPLETPSFESEMDDLIYFNPWDAVGVGTTAGNSYFREFYIGKTLKTISVQHQSIYIPNHPFKTNQAVTLSMPAFDLTGQVATRIPVRNTPDSVNMNLPDTGTSQTVYIINKSKDYIGIVTQVGLTTSTDGLYFQSDGSNALKYSLLSSNTKVTGNAKKIKTKVAIATEHNLENSDIVELVVNPNQSLGIGNSASVFLKYNQQYQRIITNPVGFSSLSIRDSSRVTNPNQFAITNHGFVTGDKIFYSANEVASGISTGSYYVYRVDDDNFQITNTYTDSISEPPIVVSIGGTGGTAHEIGYINPQLEVRRDNDLIFNLSDSSLSGYQFKLFYDNALNNEFVSTGSTSTFSLVRTTNPGSTGAQLTIIYNKDLPTKLYYSLEKGSKVIASDTDVKDYSQILYTDSLYNGKYKVFGVGTTDFYISLDEIPERVGYAYSDCSVLKYTTSSKNSFGPISKLNIISGGSNYTKLPQITGLSTGTSTDDGINAILKPESTTIGQLNNFRILNEGFEYSADKTLSPEADINTYLGLQSAEKISRVDVIDGGRNYISPPDLVVVNEYTREAVDSGSIQVKRRSNITENTINEVEIVEEPKGLDSVAHRIYAVNNSNGIQVSRVKTYDRENGIVELELITPAINGFINPPFAKGDSIFVEGIGKKKYTDSLGTVTSPGNGFNSADNGYNFFTVTDYTNSNPAILKYDIGTFTDDAGDILSTETTFTSIVKSTNYPSFKLTKVPSFFYEEELLKVNGNETDLKVNVIEAKYIKVTGEYEIKVGDNILGATSGNIAVINDVRRYNNRFVIEYANKKEFGWKDSVGILNNDLQVLSDNDYYQNLSYTVKSPVTWEKQKDSVNKLVHATGMKNFADTEVISKTKVGIGVSQSLSPVLDFISYRRVDTINNYDLVVDYDVAGGGLGGAGGASRFISFKSKRLSDYINCQTNRVLQIDDISPLFSSSEMNKLTYTDVSEYPITDFYSKYFIQVSDTLKQSTQLSEIVVLNDYNNTYTNSKVELFTDKRLGKFEGTFGDVGNPVLRFTPDDPNNYSYDVKVYKESYDAGWYNIGVGFTDIGFSRLNSKTERVTSGVSTTVYQVQAADYDTFYAHAHITDESNNRQNYYEIAGFYDGTNTHITETYFDTAAYTGISTGFIGTFGASVSGGVLKLNYNSGTNNSVLVKTKVIGIGQTTAGIGTYRFLVGGQNDGTERTTRLESKWKEISGITTVFTLDSALEFSTKSVIKVGAGVTAAVHNLWVVADQTNQNISQSYFLTQGSKTGIGTFSLERTGTKVAVKFHPDTAYANSGVEVQAYTQYIYADVDQYNKPNNLDYGTAIEGITNAFYGSINDYGKDKKNFDLNYKNIPIFEKTFNPSDINTLNRTTGLFSINDHFFETGEELIYTADTTLIGAAATSVGIGTTIVGGAAVTGDLITGFSTITGIANTTGLSVGNFVYGQNIPANTTITGIATANTYFIGNVSAASSVITGIANTSLFTVGAGIYSGNNVGLGTIVSIGINSITSTENIADAGTNRVWYSTNSNWALTLSNVSTGSTIRQAYTTGISTDIMPKKVYAIKIGKNSFKLTGTLGLDGNVGTAFTYTSVGVGNRHKLEMKKKNSKTLITVDGVTQYPIAYTPLEYKLANNTPIIGAGVTYLSLSGISSIKPRDILRVNEEYFEISNVGLGTTAAGPITGIGTVPVIHVERGFVGSAATAHADGTVARIYKGAYNIVGNEIWFTASPDGQGNNNQLNSSALKRANSTFNGRVYLRQDYTRNKIYDDISLEFNGIGQTFTVYKEGEHTTGVEAGSDFVFINDVFQTPNTVNNAGNNYAYGTDKIAGITSVTFTGITKAGTDDILIVDSDINQNQLPRGGVVVSLGNTGGQGYAPLVGASVTATLNSSGSITAIGIGTTGSLGSGYRGSIGIGITDEAYVHKFVSAVANAVTRVTAGSQPPNRVPTKANYESHSGLLTLTLGSGHGLVVGNVIRIAENGLTFTCSRDKHDSNHTYPRSTDPAGGNANLTITAITTESITVNVGAGGGAGTGANIEASVGARHEHSYVTSDANAVYRGGNYTHTFVSAVPGGVSVTGIGTTSATAATYNAVTGNLVLTINQHNLVAGTNTVEIDKESLTFTCSKDNHATQHSYPRLTDPAYNSTLAIGATTLNTLTVNVGASPIVNYQISDAVYNSATGDVILTSVGHGLTTGTIVGIATTSIEFTCSRDNHATKHRYPRLTDPANNKSIAIGATSVNTFTLDVGASQSGDGGELTFNLIAGGSGYVNPRFDIDDPSYQDLSVTGASRLGVGKTTTTGIGLSMTFDATPRRVLPLTDKGGDAAILIRKNKTLISEVAVGRMLDKYNPPNPHNYTGGTATNAVTINGTQKNVTGAVYTPETGDLVLTIGSHSFTTSHTAIIAEESLKFKCALDNFRTEHKYPRSTDPAFETALPITAKTGTTVTVNVGAARFTVASDLGGNYAHTWAGGTATNAVNVQTGSQAGNQKSPNGGTYNAETGVLTLTFASAHSVSSGDTITLDNNSLTFTCAKDNHATQHTYPRLSDPASGATLTVTKVSNTSFSVNVGAAGYNKQDCIDDVADVIDAVAYNVEYGGNDKVWDAANFYITGDHVAGEEKETVYAMREASSMAIQAMRNETIGVHSGAQYKHTFVSAGVGSITVGTGSTNIGIGTTTATSATYDPVTGLLVLTIPGHTYKGAVGKTATNVAYTPTSGITTITVPSHGLNNGDLIKIVDESIVFTCAKDTHSTEHKYPRSSDPASGTWYAITNKTANTFRINVGAANDATVGVHTFVSASTAGILTAVNSIGIQTNSITFTCDRDESGTNATYPRTTDPFHNKIIAIASTTTNTLTVDVGISTHKYTTASQFKDKTIRGDQTRTEGEYTVGDCALVASAINTLVGIVTIAIGSTQMPPKTPSSVNTYEISGHTIKKPGYSFERGDFFKPVGLVTAVGYVGDRYKHKFVSSGVGSVVSGGGYTHTFVSANSDAVFTGGDYPHVFVGAADSAVVPNSWAGIGITPTGAVYTPSTGNLELTFASRHNLKGGTDTIGIATNSLTFTCARDNFTTEHAYPRKSDPIHNKVNIAIGATTLTKLNVNVGLSTFVTHAVSIGTYHPNTGELELLVGEGHSFKQASSHAITTASYEPSTGILELGVTNHGFSKGEYIQIPDNSLRFTCAKDNHATFHTYPRTDVVSKDPTRGKWLPIDGVGVSTFRVNVGKANDATVGLHSFFSASANLRYAVDAGIGTVGSIGIATESISFTCAKDDNATTHSYPRLTDPIHGAVIGIGSTSRYAISVNVGVSSLVSYTPKGANYNPETGELVLITNTPHHLTTNNKVGILTGGLVFSCAKDGYTSDHAYPRAGFAHTFSSAMNNAMNVTGGTAKTPSNAEYNPSTGDMTLTFASNHGLSVANTISFEGYSLTFTCSKDDHKTLHSYPRPTDPVWAKTIAIKKVPTNKKIVVNVGKSNTGDPALDSVLGITTYTTYTFTTNVGKSPVAKPAKEIIFSVEDTFSDSFGSWQLGEFDYIDSVKDLQDGKRTRFPLYKNKQLLSFQKDEQDPIGSQIDLDAVLLIYVNGVMQEPKVSYEFNGGTTFFFKEAPLADDKVDVFFYRGTRDTDSFEKDIKETIKPGDDLQILKHPDLPATITQDSRIVSQIAQSDLVETGIYLGDGINSIDYKPVNWIKQKRDLLFNDNTVAKTRDSLEPMVFPTSRIISNFNSKSIEIFLDNSQFFNYEENESTINIQSVDAIILDSVDPISATLAPVVSAAGSVTSITITNGGNGYAPNSIIALDISDPIGGIGNTIFKAADGLDLVPCRVGIGSTTLSGINTTGISTGMSIHAIGNGVNNRDSNNNEIYDWDATFPSNVIVVGIRTEYTCFAGTCRTFGVVDIGTGWNNSGIAVTTTAVGIGKTIDIAVAFGKYEVQVAAAATATTNASGVIVSTTVSNTGSGYTATNSLPYYKTADAPEVIAPEPPIVDETLTKIRFVEGFSGIVTGITTATGIGVPLALEFHTAYNSTDRINDLKVGYPIHISDTTVGHGVTSINDSNAATVGIGTTFADNIYQVHAISRNNLVGVITCNVHSGINTAGVHTMGGINEGKFSWGRLAGFKRSNAPIGLAVTGYIINSGLTTFPTIQRRGYGLRDSGSLRKDLGL